MKIIIACYMHLDELPPMMTALKVLSEKYDVLYIGVDEKNDKYTKLLGYNVEFVNVVTKTISEIDSIQNRIKRYLCRRKYYVELYLAKKIIEKKYNTGDLIWIHHEYTLMHMGKLELPYCLSMYELPRGLFEKENELKKRVRAAHGIAVPEYTRAAIVQACLGLERMPAVLPNKPYDFENLQNDIDRNIQVLFDKIHDNGKRIIVYSGIFLRERKLEPFIEAILDLKDRWELVLIGRESDYLHEILNKYPQIHYLGFFSPPNHLPIIEKTDVGILTYVADSGSINPVFCAPNKIWEYAKYGIPMICNDIPGLKYTVEYNKLGLCCDITSLDSIRKCLQRIDIEYNELSDNAGRYYNSLNIDSEIIRFVNNNMNWVL